MFCMSPYRPIGKMHLFPCGNCVICRTRRRNEWTIRMILESAYHADSSFITLTYSPEHRPLTLSKRDLQLFMKRLRKFLSYKVRYFACGEYTPKNHYPHYHAIIFGMSPFDGYLIEKAWPYGFIKIDPCNIHTMRYVAGYVSKKLAHFGDTDEFILTSRRPGLGGLSLKALLNFSSEDGTDVVKRIQIDDKKVPLPKYILNKLRELKFSPEYLEELKKCNLEDYETQLKTWAYEASLIEDEELRIKDAQENLRTNVLRFHSASNENFIKLSKIYKRKEKLL